MAFTFKKAVRSESKLRLALEGISGSGKTYSALRLAKGLGGKIAVIDTERGSASLYSGLEEIPEFDVLELIDDFSPDTYIKAIKAAEEAGYDIIILDSITPEWTGKNGCLELVDYYANGNSFNGWKKVTPMHRSFLDAILNSKCHVIATMRAKSGIVIFEGKAKKVTDKTEQRDGIEFEFTCLLTIDRDSHKAIASKDRTGLFNTPEIITEKTGEKLKSWIDSALKIPDEIREKAFEAAYRGKDSILLFMNSLKKDQPDIFGLFTNSEKKDLFNIAKQADIEKETKS